MGINDDLLSEEEREMFRKVLSSVDKVIEDSTDDMVNRPAHYTQGNIECIDAMVAARGPEAVAIYCEMAAFKYIWRCGLKDTPHMELGKAAWYLNKAQELRKLADI